MRARIPLIVISSVGLCAFSATRDSETGLDTSLCTTTAENVKTETNAVTKQALKIQIGRSTREDVAGLLGEPWRATNDADCEATQYGERWEYLAEGANGPFRIQVAFGKDGKASLVAKIPPRGRGGAVILAFAPENPQEHPH